MDQEYPLAKALHKELQKMMVVPLYAGGIHSVLNGMGREIIPELYKQLQKVELKKDPSVESVRKWFLYQRPNMSQAFAYAYAPMATSVYGRLSLLVENRKGTVLSQGISSFKEAIYARMASLLPDGKEFVCVDLISCHSQIFAGMFPNTSFKEGLDSEEGLWSKMAGQLEGVAGLTDTRGENFYWLKKLLKILTYKTLQGGNPRGGLAEHIPLQMLFKDIKADELQEKGLKIVENCAISELTQLSELAGRQRTLFLPMHTTPFNYSLDKTNMYSKVFPPFPFGSYRIPTPEHYRRDSRQQPSYKRFSESLLGRKPC